MIGILKVFNSESIIRGSGANRSLLSDRPVENIVVNLSRE
jgi:hypothetical protein